MLDPKVVNHKEGNAREDMMSVKTTPKELDLPKTSVKIKDPRVNETEFSKKLCATIKTYLVYVLMVAEKHYIMEKQSKQKMSKGLKSFIETLATSDKEKRDFFLNWMKFKTHS